MTQANYNTFSQVGDCVFPNQGSQQLERLPAATYTIEADPMKGLFFQKAPDMEVAGKMYGGVPVRIERIMRTYEHRSNNTGVLLTGEKGSGKTMLARQLSAECRKLNMPTIIINKGINGASLLTLLRSIEQPYMLFIDEFEKVYSEKPAQESMLPIFDGVLGGKRMTVVTCNDMWKLSDYLLNRPGRFFYHIKYSGLEEDAIREYCEENLTDKSQVDAVVAASGSFAAFNFDMMQALVAEMNLYSETPREAIAFLNMEVRGETDWQLVDFELAKSVKAHWVKLARHRMPNHMPRLSRLPEAERTQHIEEAMKSLKFKPHGLVKNVDPFVEDFHFSFDALVSEGGISVQVDANGIGFEPDDIKSFTNGVLTLTNDYGTFRFRRHKKPPMYYGY